MMKSESRKSKVKRNTSRLLTFTLFSLFPFFSFSQQSTSSSVSVTSNDSSKVDTNFVRSYTNKLIIGLWQSERRFDIHINQKTFQDTGLSAINYVANSNQVSGISVDYDIIGFAFGYRSLPGGNARTGSTNYMDLGLNINTRGVRFENSYKRYTGFYDNNTANYTHPWTDSVYFQNPSMNLRVVKSKVLYTFNKRKFALGAAYANVKRQMRSKGSWLVVGNFYAMNLYSDSSLIPPPLRPIYGPIWDGFNKMNIYAYSAGFGATYTLVIFRRFYFNFLGAFGLERQYRHFYTIENVHYSYWKTWSAGDWRVSFGYNGKKFFIRGSTIYDINNYESNAMKFDMKFISGSFDFGYRFNFRAPKPYQKFQETKLYKML